MKTSGSHVTKVVALAFLSALILVPAVTRAQVPRTISYQGSLTDNAGNPVTASLGISFRLYDSPNAVGATLLWAETQTVNVANGAFDVVLGADPGNPLAPSMFDIPLYLGIAVGGDAEMIPRQALAAVGYSFRSLLPVGAVMFFDLPACPAGWSELVAAQGRTLVGLPDGGTINGAVGAPLADQENRLHTHDVNPPSAASTTVASHVHAVDPPTSGTSSVAAHNHVVDPPSASSTPDSHNHRWAYITSGEAWISFTSTGGTTTMIDYGASGVDVALLSSRFAVSVASDSTATRTYFTDNDSHSHTTNIGSFGTSTSGAHGHSVNIPSVTSTAAGAHGHDVDMANTTSTVSSTADAMPYLQLRVCRKD